MTTIASIAALLENARTRAGLSQRELAARANTAQSVVANIERGQGNPTVETVQRLLSAAGFDFKIDLREQLAADPVIEAYKKDVDRTLLIENLRRTPEQRMQGLVAMARLRAETGRARRVAERKR